MKPAKLFGWMFRLVGILLPSALFITFITPSWVLAQSTDDVWSAPLNLSHSGGATNPAIVTDSEGIVHAVWQDDLANYMYARLDGDQWSAPEKTNLNLLFELPLESESTSRSESGIYTGPNPLFLAAPGPDTFAFWISPQGKLFTSKVRNQDFKKIAAWDARHFIAPEAAYFDVAIDARGELHVAYLRTVGDPLSPPGIYYTHSKNSGLNWTVPVLLYESPYFRRLTTGEANLSITTAGTEDTQRVYIAWDNRPRKQVFLAQSADDGKTWEQLALVAGPASDSGSAGSLNIHVGATQNSVVLVWQSGRATNGLLPSCSQIYQFSNDAGATWSNPQPMIEDMVGCAQSNEFVTGLANSPEGLLYFLTETKNQVFLTAWNGHQWSQLQEQPILSGFEEPEIYTEVIYGCHRASLLGARLYVVGCDQGEGGDIWVTSRSLEAVKSWFMPPLWSQLSPVARDSYEMETVGLVATDDGFIHAFFSQHQDPAIYYTYWDGEFWSRINPVLELPEGEAAWPAIAAGPENELFLIARNNLGKLYFSRATSGNSASESRWSKPARLQIGHDGEIGSVDIAWDSAGTLYVAYSVPVNAERGIYLVQSKDHGTSWSEPIQVFNGAAAGFDLVGAPSLLTSANGLLHIIWKEQSLQGDGDALPRSLYYARSDDDGQSFSDAKLVVEEPVAWREIVTDGKGNLHLLWQPQDTPTTVWDQVSLDGGHTWQYPQGLPDIGKLAAVSTDPAGRLHLVGVGLDALGHWLWDGSRWQSEPPLDLTLSSQKESPVELLSAAVNTLGEMMVILAEPTGEGDEVERTLLYANRTLQLPVKQTAIQGVPTKTALPPTLVAITPTLEPSSTPASTVNNEPTNSPDQMDRSETNDQLSPFKMALLPVTVLLISVLGIMIWQATQNKDR
ncbi:MAG TPA: hypothetical protein VK909_01590 [Anaerolineales bacterium]|nr:hypothetical protein [Anaerolineales bacterium]